MDFIEYIEGLDHNLVTIVSIVGSLTVLAGLQYRFIMKELNAIFIQLAKNFLVRTLSKLEEGREISDIEMQGFKDTYGLYLKKGGNTYIKERYEKDKADGLF